MGDASMKLPTLSVVIPNYNHGRFLPECLDSLVTQSITPEEIVVVDDCSTDNSLAVVEEYKKKCPVLSCVRNEKNMGVNYTLNRGVNLARGEYIFLPGADDRVTPEYFTKTLSLLAENPQAALCFPDPASFDHATGRVSNNHVGLSETPRFFTPQELVQFSRRKRLLMSGGSVYKTTVLREVGGYREELRWHSDYFATFVIAFRYGACYYPESLYQWRATPQSYMTAGVRKLGAQREVVRRLLELLQSPEFADVAPRFRDSGALALAPRITMSLVAQRKYWPFITPLLLKRALPADVFWMLPHQLQRIIRNAVARLR
jgi:glycosyltransferase involved in cell wall biosynthesis